ncbi:MAG: rhodanese-like domain-containing protein [Epsilonproteobacteria bacterium]|nr:rhodanese-like domain-containing protein [Campylobacterota bacterium]
MYVSKKKMFLIGMLVMQTMLFAQGNKSNSFDAYLQKFDYQARKDMKISTEEMLKLVAENKAIVIDIRFKEEYEAWHMDFFAKNIPLNELPTSLDTLDKEKLIITACPHNDRANIARLYLMLKGYRVKYLKDGLLSVAEYLRGDKAKNFIKGKK